MKLRRLLIIAQQPAPRDLSTSGYGVALSFLCGVMIFFIAALMLAMHHSFGTLFAAVISVFIILMGLEGLVIMFAPGLILSLPAGIGFQHHSRSWGGIALFLGLGLSAWVLL